MIAGLAYAGRRVARPTLLPGNAFHEEKEFTFVLEIASSLQAAGLRVYHPVDVIRPLAGNRPAPPPPRAP
jgi:hypothetical protein